MDIETLQGDSRVEPTHLSRPPQSVITTTTRDRFDAAAQAIWPLLVARLRRAGASPEDAEDVAQEALLRAWDRGIGFADDGDLLRWCTVVARRWHIDRVRRQARLLALGERASDSACRDLEAVELRHVLGTVTTALTHLTEQERASLEALPSADRASQVRTAVARHRARSRLRLLVGPFAALVAQLTRALRRSVPAATAVGALAAAALVVGLGTGVDHGSPAGGAPTKGITPTLTQPQTTSARAHARPSGLAHRVGTGQRRPGSPAPVVDVHGPAGAGGAVSQHDPAPGEPPLCIHDSTLGKFCVPAVVPPQPNRAPGVPEPSRERYLAKSAQPSASAASPAA